MAYCLRGMHTSSRTCSQSGRPQVLRCARRIGAVIRARSTRRSSLLPGIAQAGLARLGFLADLLSEPVLVGYWPASRSS